MAIMNKARCLAAMTRTPAMLQAVLREVSTEQARLAKDGPDGWSVLEIVCHLRDFDGYFQDRIQLMLVDENPRLPAYDHEAIAIDSAYQNQALPDSLAAYLESRRSFVQLVSGLSEEQLERTGIHPEAGEISVLDQAFRSVTHDIDHTEQIVRALGLAQRF